MNQEINKAFEIIKEGGIILYPTDTVWGISCDATNPEAVAKIYKLKQRAETQSMICLMNGDKKITIPFIANKKRNTIFVI